MRSVKGRTVLEQMKLPDNITVSVHLDNPILVLFYYQDVFANKVLGTIVSTPQPDVGIGDVGMKALSTAAAANATIEGIHGVTIEEVQDEHIVLRSDGSAPLEVGQQFMVLPGYQDHLINRWDQYIGVRKGVVEQVWDIPGRGCLH